MKQVILLVAMTVSSFGWSGFDPQTNLIQFRNYELAYMYDAAVAMVPSTIPPGEPHYYNARCDVFRVEKDGSKTFLGTTVGTFSHGGCCRNDKLRVMEALNQAINREPVNHDFTLEMTKRDWLIHELAKVLADAPIPEDPSAKIVSTNQFIAVEPATNEILVLNDIQWGNARTNSLGVSYSLDLNQMVDQAVQKAISNLLSRLVKP